MKECISCNVKKETNDFYTQQSNKDKLMKKCKKCFNFSLSISSKEYHKQYDKKYKDKYKESNKEYSKNYRNNNKEYYKEYSRKYNNIYQKNKKQKDILYKIGSNIRTRISQTINGYSKSKTTLHVLGLNNFTEFKEYIESKFQNEMNWNNYGFGKGKWVIDHIIPISSALTEDEIYKLNHYTNLQPLWWDENIIKSNKII
jgi:hypothetical protein